MHRIREFFQISMVTMIRDDFSFRFSSVSRSFVDAVAIFECHSGILGCILTWESSSSLLSLVWTKNQCNVSSLICVVHFHVAIFARVPGFDDKPASAKIVR